MSNLRPTPTLDTDKLCKSYKKVNSMKKKFVQTKYLKRNQVTLRHALKKRQEVFDNLPLDLSPLYWNHRPRRRSSDIDL